MMDPLADYDISQYVDITSQWQNNPTAYLSQYYTLFFKTVDKSADPLASNVYVRQLQNKICVLGITDPSPKIVKVEMNKSLINSNIKKDTVLCVLKDEEDQVVGHVKAEMEGKLLELNSVYDTKETVSFLEQHNMDTGFIAIILPKIDDTEEQLRGFQTEEECNSFKNRI